MADHLMGIGDAWDPDPGLDFSVYAGHLADMLRHAQPPQLTLGVFGGYGSGKTTLMRAIKSKLDAGQGTAVLATVWFNAWRYDHEKHLFLPFLAALQRGGLVEDAAHKKSLKLAFRSFLYGLKLKSPFVDLLAKDAIDREKELTEEEQRRSHGLARLTGGYLDIPEELGKLTELNGGGTRRIVIFIDDLDRCVPAKAFQLLEAMKAFTDIEGFLFVVGLDPRVISRYLDDKFHSPPPVTPAEYLEKLFQVGFQIPEPTAEQIAEILPSLKELLPPGTGDVLGQAAPYLPRSLRRIKRLVNAHQVLLAVSPGLAPGPLLALLVLQDVWPSVYGAMYTHGMAICQRLAHYMDGGTQPNIEGEISKVDQAAAEAWAEEGLAAFYRATLRHLLPKEEAALRRYLRLLGKPKEKLAI